MEVELAVGFEVAVEVVVGERFTADGARRRRRRATGLDEVGWCHGALTRAATQRQKRITAMRAAPARKQEQKVVQLTPKVTESSASRMGFILAPTDKGSYVDLA